MGNLFGGGQQAPTPATPSLAPDPNSPLVIGPYPDDGARRMPLSNSPTEIAAARKKRDAIISRSGRTSTRLAPDSGTRSYSNSFLGSVS